MKKKNTFVTDSNLYDTRLLKKHLQDGFISLKDHEKHIKDLADEASNVKYIEVYEEPSELDSEDSSLLTFTSG